MKYRNLVSLFTVAVFTLLVPLSATAQSGDGAPRTSWDKPDLQGVWDFATMTPLERPAQFAGKETLTEEDAAAVVANNNQLWQRISEGGDNSTGTYDEFWFDAGTGVTEDRRTSLITDPADGKVPPLTATAAARVSARRAYLRDHPADSWEDRNIAERCILGFNTGPPMNPSAYNNVVQLFQTEDHVVLLNEMVHDSRIVPLDNRPHLPPHMRQWHGDSRGYWEGDTLVVETTNYSAQTRLRFPSSSETTAVERFTRINADLIDYQFTVEDPSVYTSAWTAVRPMPRIPDYRIYEYSCHEGNYAMSNILSGERQRERVTARD